MTLIFYRFCGRNESIAVKKPRWWPPVGPRLYICDRTRNL